jgi:hypothetical protein
VSHSTRLLVVSVALCTAVTVAAPASADPAPKPLRPAPSQPSTGVPAGFASWDAVYAYQDRLNAAAKDILAADGGNASIVASPQNRQLRVYWHGAVPTAVRQLAAKADVPVVFLPAAYPFSELVAEAQRLAADPRVGQVAPKADGSGLSVSVTTDRVQQDATDLLRTSKIPLTITVEPRPQAMFSRQDDTPFFWGGSRYFSPIGGCSNGFSLKIFLQPNAFMLSAGHCAENGQPINIPLQPAPTGTALAKNLCRDTLVINYPAGTAGAIYSGGPNSSSGLGVVDVASDFVGNLISTGGATSGEHPGLLVTAVNVFAAIGGIPCSTVGPLTVAVHPLGQCAVAPGDSGGPAYSPSGGGVMARGTITAGNVGAAICPAPGGGTVAGGNQVLYAPLLRPPGDPQRGSLQFYGFWVQP